MKIRQLIVAGAVALLLSQGAMAAAKKTDRCTSLEAKFDKRAASSTSPDLEKAKGLRDEGSKLCSDGKKAEGSKKLSEAVKLLAPAKKAK